MDKKIITNTFEETMTFAQQLAGKIPSGSTILLYGDLGAGKTTFVRGLAKGLNVPDIVQSPTFNIMKLYLKGDRPLIHIDSYRLNDTKADIGLEEYIGYESGITVIEWPMYIDYLLPKNCIKISLSFLDDNKREILISSDDNLLEDL